MVLQDKEMRKIYIKESRSHYRTFESVLQRFTKQPDNDTLLKAIRKSLHSLEGNSTLAGEYQVAYLITKIRGMVKAREFRNLPQFLTTLKQLIEGFQKEKVCKETTSVSNRKVTTLLKKIDVLEEKRTKVEDELKESEERYRSLVETSPDCIKLFNLKGNLLFINKGGMKEHRLKNQKEALKFNALDSIMGKDKKKFIKALKDGAKGKTTTFEIEHLKKHSTRDFCLETISPVRDKEGKIISVFGVSRDISDIKKSERMLQEQKNQFVLRIAKIRQERIRLRGKIAKIRNPSQELRSIEREKKELLHLIKENQNKYFVKGKLTRSHFMSEVESVNFRLAELEKEKTIIKSRKEKKGNFFTKTFNIVCGWGSLRRSNKTKRRSKNKKSSKKNPTKKSKRKKKVK